MVVVVVVGGDGVASINTTGIKTFFGQYKGLLIDSLLRIFQINA